TMNPFARALAASWASRSGRPRSFAICETRADDTPAAAPIALRLALVVHIEATISRRSSARVLRVPVAGALGRTGGRSMTGDIGGAVASLDLACTAPAASEDVAFAEATASSALGAGAVGSSA